MTVTSFSFLILLLIGMIVYYLLPKKTQWVTLLGMSICFYFLATDGYTIIFLMISTVIAYFSTMYIFKLENDTKKNKVSQITVLAIVINVIIWFLLKGSSFWILGSGLVHSVLPDFPIIPALPWAGALGMGYYTAQIIGYILDVSWGNISPQTNIAKLFLFVSFFPQLTVGPISRYNDMTSLYENHKFSYENLCFGSQRIIWGLFKKLVLSDRVGIIVSGIWANTQTYFGLWIWVAVLLYPIQIYTDFSGCMDIVLGAAQLFDIKLAENFRNPFFARNSQEFWQRWHITLGTWARDYIYYPVLKSKFLISLGKKCKKKFGKKMGKFIPWAIGMAILWFVMGFWHGSVRHIFGVSLWFWTMLILAELTAPVWKKIIEIFDFKTQSFSWHLFQSTRTYIVYAIGAVFFSANGIKDAFSHFKLLLTTYTNYNPWIFFDGSVLNLGVTWGDINLIILGVIALLIVAGLREKYQYARIWMSNQSIGLRWLTWILLFVIVLIYGKYGPGYEAAEFIYQGF